MEAILLKDILIIFALSIGVLLICHRFHVAATVGLLLTGILAGPHFLGLISAVKEVESLAEIGVILLLFTIGIEFSIENLLRIKRTVLFGGGLQVLLVISVVFVMSNQIWGLSFVTSIFIGFVLSLSSTAIVLKLLQEKSEIESPHGQIDLSLLLFQDIIVAPMMLLIPFLAGIKNDGQSSFSTLIIKGLLFLLFVLLSAKWLVPKLLLNIARTRSRELFLLSILVICFTTAFLTQSMGLSLALGAFFAGLIISTTEYSHESLGKILPFRDVFTSLFFVSIGMLLDVRFLLHNPGLILFATLATILLKTFLISIVVILLGFPLRTCLIAGLTLCQIGEFSFILLMKGVEFGLLSKEYYQIFLNVSVLTMGITPFLFTIAPSLADKILLLPFPKSLKKGLYGALQVNRLKAPLDLKDHLIIVGFGFNGRNLAFTAKLSGIPYVITEMNPQTVKNERKKGELIYYGDASQDAVLNHVNIKQARIIVIVISDPMACRQIVPLARKENPSIQIIVRTRFISEIAILKKLGADEVIPEEFETSVEIFSRVLNKYLVPIDKVQGLINQIRVDGYEMLRTLSCEPTDYSKLKAQVPGLNISTFIVKKDTRLIGKNLENIQLRKKYGVTLLAIKRGEIILPNPSGDTYILEGDLLFILGEPSKMSNIGNFFS